MAESRRTRAVALRPRVPGLVLATELGRAEGGLAWSAAVAVALADLTPSDAVLLVDGGAGRRGPTLLASAAAREAESRLAAAGFEATARGRLTWLAVDLAAGPAAGLAGALDAGRPWAAAVVHLPAPAWRDAIEHARAAPAGILLRADLPADRSLAALAVRELGAEAPRSRVRVVAPAPGRVATRRALAGLDPGGELSRRAARIARGLASRRRAERREPARPLARAASLARAESGQALPLVLGAALVLCLASLALAALGGAVTGNARAQRLADLAALSAARSMHDDLDRLLAPAELPNGSPNPRHVPRTEYLARAERAGLEAASRNGADPGRIEVSFPDAGSFAPLRAAAEVRAGIGISAALPEIPVRARAEAEAAAPATASQDGPGAGESAAAGGYSGPLAVRQGEEMRPDVAAAFDRLAAAARADGVDLLITSAYRSDAEQAALWAQNPDPRWVAPPGTSLHRCATELDLGPAGAYGWLATHAPRFGFVKRYPWEPWHYGYAQGPAPCSAAGDALPPGGAARADGSATEGGLPAFVPARFRAAIARAAARWNVSATLLAAQLLAESNFNPYAVSPAGARGIAQFMPATAAAYGLENPFDPDSAIDAQARLMSDLLGQFDGAVELALAGYNAGPAPVAACWCVPPYPETQGYVARILALMDGAGALVAPALEVRLVS